MKSEFIINAKKHPLYALVNDSAIVGCTMGGLQLNTEVSLNKFYKDEDGVRTPNEHFGRVTKIQVVNCRIATEKATNSYVSGNNRELEKRGLPADFESEGHRYADQIKNSAIWVHRDNGQAYMRYYLNLQNKPTPAQYFLDGFPIEWKDIKGTKPPRKQSIMKRIDNAGNSVEIEKIAIRNVKVENVDIANLMGGSHKPNAIDYLEA